MNIKNYKFSGINAGIKKGKLDLGLIYSEQPAVCIAAFTKNLLKSNSIIVSEQHLQRTKYIRCILANSGCANTACGKNGIKITEQICSEVARKLKIKKEEVIIASTGVIGEPLPKNKILDNLNHLVANLNTTSSSIINFAKSIMTTDTKPKIVYKSININNLKGNILCIAKGAGMIAPNLEMNNKPHATMLVFMLTDLSVPKSQMQKIMQHTIIPNFNSFSIDGDTSPNDTIFFVSNKISNKKLNKYEFAILNRCVENVCRETINKLLYDGEGVTKVVKIVVEHCDEKNAQLIAKTVANSLLVKTAIHGADPNWGRILSCCGRSGAKIDINKIDIWIDKYQVVKNGTSCFAPDNLIRKVMLKKFFEVRINIKSNKFAPSYTFYTTDLSKKYVDINSKYKT